MLGRVLELELRLRFDAYPSQELVLDDLDLGYVISLLLAGLESALAEELNTEVVEGDDDFLDKCPRQAKAATSKAEFVDGFKILADVSTYITAPDCLDIASAC